MEIQSRNLCDESKPARRILLLIKENVNVKQFSLKTASEWNPLSSGIVNIIQPLQTKDYMEIASVQTRYRITFTGCALFPMSLTSSLHAADTETEQRGSG